MLLQWPPCVGLACNTPLLEAARHGNTQLVQQLLDAGAQIEATNWVNETPLHVAAGLGHLEVIRLLIKRGANVNGSKASV
jgi:ankyrin repeat protein